ncbi:hypothetical protein V5E97_19095 [Singulisphaera sp. Ch08]|uniref:Uncharacterized protein n=1 Tax=Singulisphaera sp. Ch08 TaxID=3120278 RepID=A0AAU7CS77_9BACT
MTTVTQSNACLQLRGPTTMDESNFWLMLEFRIEGETQGFADRRLRGLWCDGFLPDRYLLDDPSPRIEGRAWIGKAGRGGWQELWGFTLLLAGPVASRASIPWACLFPPYDVTRWLTIDLTKKSLVIEPGVAVPDGRPRDKVVPPK